MKMGTAKRCITPQTPLRLCGFAFRKGNFSRVAEDIYVRVHFFEHCGSSIVFIYGDLIAWSNDFVAEARQIIKNELHLNSNQVYFTASHNHSGPPSGSSITRAVETPNPAYRSFLMQEVLLAVKQAKANFEDITIYRYDGECEMNVYRRYPEAKGVQMRPNYDIKPDRSLTITAFYRADGSLKGSFIHYACHANLAGLNVLHPDYPGIALRMMDERHLGSISLFLQGCTGDLRPNSVLGEVFRRCDYAAVVQYAKQFCEACEVLLDKKGSLLEPVMHSEQMLCRLPLTSSITRAEAQALLKSTIAIEKDWAKKVLEKNMASFEELELGLIFFAKGLIFFTLNAEVSQDYAAFARELSKNALCIGYTNGMIGYICTAEQIQNGGYEPSESALYFALNGTYPTETEQTIQNAMKTLLQSNLKEK